MIRGTAQRNTKITPVVLALAALAASAFSVAVAAEGDKEVPVLRVIGIAEGSGFSSRHAAIQNARESVVTEILNKKVAWGDLRPFRSMLRNADRYITRIEELHLDSDAGQTRVEVDAYIDMRSIEHDLAGLALPRLATPPTASVLIAFEDDQGELYLEEPGLAETTIAEGLKKQGLEPTTHIETAAQHSPEALRAALIGDLEKAADYAKETLADAVILGIIRVERGPSTDEGGTAKTRVTLDARVFRGTDGDLLEVFARSAAITGNNPAECQEEATIDAATKMLGDITITTVLSVLSTQKRNEVMITIHNPGSRSRIDLLVGLLDRVDAVNSIEESFFSERLARLRVGYEGPLSFIVDLISDKNYDGRVLNVLQVVGRDMNLEMAPLPGAE